MFAIKAAVAQPLRSEQGIRCCIVGWQHHQRIKQTGIFQQVFEATSLRALTINLWREIDEHVERERANALSLKVLTCLLSVLGTMRNVFGFLKLLLICSSCLS